MKSAAHFRPRAERRTRAYNMSNRAAQAEATRERIRAAAVALYIERELDGFTLEEVARRAEVTVQTVLRAYKSKVQLLMAALSMLVAHGRTMKTPARPGAVAGAVTVIFELYETIGDLVIRWLADEHRLPGLKHEIELGRRGHADWVNASFAPQLSRGEGTAQAQLFSALMVATDVYIWKLLRRDQQLDRSSAEAIMSQIIAGILREV